MGYPARTTAPFEHHRSSVCGTPIPIAPVRRACLDWDNGDRTVLVNSAARRSHLGWNLNHTAADEPLRSDRGTAFHTRIILERMSEHGTGSIADPRRRDPAEERDAQSGLRLGARQAGPDRAPPRPGDLRFPGGWSLPHDSRCTTCALSPYRTVHPDPSAVRTYGRLFTMHREPYSPLAIPVRRPLRLARPAGPSSHRRRGARIARNAVRSAPRP